MTAFPSNKSVESSSVASFTTRAADSIAVYSQGALPETSAAAHRDVDTATLASHSTAISSITAARRRDAPGATEASTSRASYTPLQPPSPAKSLSTYLGSSEEVDYIEMKDQFETTGFAIDVGDDALLSPNPDQADHAGDYRPQDLLPDQELRNKSWCSPQTIFAYLKSPDFAEIGSCVAFFLVMMIINFVNPTPRQRPIPYQYLQNTGDYIKNLVNDAPYAGYDTVSSTMLVVLAEILPLLIQLSLAKLCGRKGDAHKAICVYLTALGLTMFVTNGVKVYCGYLRPIFYNVCDPNGNFSECQHDSNEARLSFPSGHSSSSFCGLMILSLYLHNRFGLPSVAVLAPQEVQRDDGTMQRRLVMFYNTPQQPPTRYRFVSIVALLPLALATFIASSRVVDNKHFPADVVGGAVLGASVSLFVNGLWYDTTPPIIL